MENADITNVYDNLLTKAEKLYNEGFYDECANNVRKVCERHVDDMLYIKGISVNSVQGTAPSLKEKIDALEHNMNAPESYFKLLHRIRITGNKGSHEQGGVTSDDAYAALKNMRALHEKVYPVMCEAYAKAAQKRAQQSIMSQNTAADKASIKEEKHLLLLVKLSLVFIAIGVLLFITGGPEIGLFFIIIGAAVKVAIEFKIRAELSGSKTAAIISMMTNDRISGNNIQRLQQEQMRQHMDWVQQEQIRQHNEWAMNETMKAGTPMSMGGYMSDNSFNNLGNGF